MLSLLKIRDGKLEWLQIIRSNDLFLGVPYNFVQFTCLQEIMAGWLGIECGSYHQISDSLHIYERDETNILKSDSLDDLPTNMDLLTLPKEKSEWAFTEIEQRIDRMIAPELRIGELQIISEWEEGPEAFRNMLAILVAEVARRHNWLGISEQLMSVCTNPVFKKLWDRWRIRTVT